MKSIRLEFRVTLALFALLSISFLIVTVTVAFLARQSLRDEAMEKLTAIASHQASAISTELDDAMGGARAMAQFFEGMITTREDANRKAVMAALRELLASRDFYFGVWVQFEPDSFDGRDAEFAGKPGESEDGSFMPYVYREDGAIVEEASTGTFAEYQEMDYYVIPKANGIETVMEPYIEEDANNAMMTSVCVPVFDGDKIIGVAGIDLLLDKFSDKMAVITPFETGRAFLLSEAGLYIGHPDRSLLNASAANYGVPETLLNAVKSGEQAIAETVDTESGAALITVVAPVKVGSAASNWSLGIVVEDRQVMAKANQITFAVAGIGLLALFICSLFTYVTIRAVAGPIKLIVASLRDIAEGEGDLTVAIQVQDKAEIGQLAHWFNTFVAKLRGIIRDVATLTVTLNTSADEMAGESESMAGESEQMYTWLQQAAASTDTASRDIQEAAGGVEQLSNDVAVAASAAETVSNNLGTVSASVEEMSANMTTIATAVEEMSSSVNTVAAAVEEMSSSLGDVSGNTNRAATLSANVSEKAGETVTVVNELDSASQQISNIVALISGIAAQTNLLALNATIEAASAGAAGKGFAVVANEVKELASRTSAATQEIGEQVNSIQEKAAGTIGAIRDIIEAIHEVNEVFGSIAAAVGEQTATVSEITRNVGYTATGANEVARNVNEAALGAAEISRSVSEANANTSAIAERVLQAAQTAARVTENATSAAERVGEAANHVSRASEKSKATRAGAEGLNGDAHALRDLAARLQSLVDNFTV